LNAKPSLFDICRGLTLNFTLQVTLFGLIILNRSLDPWGSLPATKVPNQKTFS